MHEDDAIEIGLKLLAVLVLVLLNGFFVAAEFAIVKIRDTQLDALIAKGNRRARIARRVVRNLDASLSACQLGITLASLGLGWVGEPVFAALLTPVMDWLKIESVTVRHSVAVVVGPEGGWTPEERDAMVASGCLAVTLGGLTLRADAVPLAAIAIVRFALEDL